MAELITQLLAHLRGMWRFRWSALVVAWLLAIAGWYWTYTLPNQYEANAQLYIDTDSALPKLLKGLSIENNVMNKVQQMTLGLKSRPNLERIARETDLDLRVSSDVEKEQLLDTLKAKIQIIHRGNNIYNISFRDHEPTMTRDVVRTLLGSFVGDALADNREETEGNIKFLQGQIEEYESRLNEAEARLAEFKKRNVGLMPGSGGSYYERLDRAMELLAENEGLVARKKRVRVELLKQIDGEEPMFGIVGNQRDPTVAASQYDAQIGEQESRLTALRRDYTDKHPDVVATLETLERLKAQRSEELAARTPNSSLRDPVTFNPLDLNPVYQNIQIALGQVDVDLADLTVRVAQQRAEVRQLQASVDKVPEVEAQLARLNRDYDVTNERYQTLLERIETARMGQTAGDSTSDVKFQIIEPPIVPLEPIGPNRILFITVTLLAGLGAGLAFSFLMDQLRPVYITRSDLHKKTGLQVLGAIGVVLMPQQVFMRRVQTAAFALGLLGLGLMYGVAVAFEEPFVELFRSLGMEGNA